MKLVAEDPCDECGSDDLKKTVYDDGHGYLNVKVVCNNCGHDTWRDTSVEELSD